MHLYVELLKALVKEGKVLTTSSDVDYDHDNKNLFSFGNKYSELDCMLLPSLRVALRCKEFLTYNSSNSNSNSNSDSNSNSNSNSNIPAELLKQYQLITIEPLNFDDIQVIYYPTSLAANARAYWQHTGEILSSRKAEAALRFFGFPVPNITELYSADNKRECLSDSYTVEALGGVSPYQILTERIMSILDEPLRDNSITITTSGMTAINIALRLIRSVLRGEGKEKGTETEVEMVLFGFPYLDTLKMLKRTEMNPGGYHFFGNGTESDIDTLVQLLIERNTGNSNSNSSSNSRIGGVFTEFPTNPLLKAPNLMRLHSLSKQYGFLLVVDDTIGNFANLNLLHHPDVKVDLLCTSLTKIFSGRGDVMAGSLVINSLGPYYDRLREAISSLQPEPLYLEDALALELNSRDFIDRSKRIMKSTAALALWLCDQEEVKHVHYPHPDVIKRQKDRGLDDASSIDPSNIYPLLLKGHVDDGYGYGCLLSIILKEDRDEKKFYDCLDFNKGPSLGTNCTLVCPYTLLAHYTELDWAASYGVDRRLVRVSVGLEDIDSIIDRFDVALKAANNVVSSL